MNNTTRAIKAALTGGIIAATLDMSYACIVTALRGVAVVRVPQSIASGVMGQAAFSGGVPTAALGSVLHYFILIVAAAIYVVASRKLRVLVERPVLSGIAFGLGIFLVMNLVVVPLSAAAGRFPAGWFLVGALLIHTLGIGMPIALATRRIA